MDEFQRIANAKKAFDDGLITEEEYETFKRNIINLTDTSQVSTTQTSRQRNKESDESVASNIGFAILGYFIPILGIILLLVWYDSRPSRSRAAGFGALGFIIFCAILWGLALLARGIR